MTTQRQLMLAVGLFVTVAGCAAQQDGDERMAASPYRTQEKTAEVSRSYRSEAYDLGEMAERRRLEADVLARELGPDHPSVQKKRRLADELRAAADDADQQARELRRTVPHGMVQ